jgi:hypothetical protein
MSRNPDRMIQSDLLLNVSFNRGDASDRSSATRTPAASAGATFTSPFCDFDGTSSAVITYPDDAAFESAPFSVSFWARIDSAVTRVSLVAKNTTTAAPETYRGWYVQYGGSAVGSFGIAFVTETNAANYRIATTGNAATYGDGTWRHFVCVCDSINTTTNWRIYVNGVSVSLSFITLGTVSSIASTEPLTLGGFSTLNQTARLNGALDDVRIYNRALSASEAAAIYAGGRD